ncbi:MULTISPECIES: HNH endonuclease family protein [unclassified Streptomyces]|uniref:HNH endonuclease family protein n=1 Tax=unclassified Streptomyces TaxID=2593676 RepID=UPI002252CB4C|nr:MULTISPECIES: HNH endonuclease family protein [unclassified Streptomyces]MCX4524207.1 HNH endonuclease family protein [Streptomyces sp. NBC_01551]MCX4545273.1 HNH endonuclease family protein [Streptomyces sp. NBC_01565]
MGRQIRVRGGALAVALVLGLSGCAGSGGGADGKGDGKADGKPGGQASGKASAPTSAPPAAGGKPAAGDVLPGMVTAAEARTRLAGLKVAKAGTMVGYSRDKFTHWAEQGNKCDTREVVLKRDGSGVKQDAECRAVSGSWKSLYDGAALGDAGKLDIDHMVPLAEAWRSGAAGWDAARRKAFANDLTHPQLLAVSASSNRSKGDQSPDLWQPTDKSSWCQYGRAWTTVKSDYGLTVTEPEKAMLTTMIDTCAR